MDMLKRLNAAMQYVEENLCGELDPDELARIACISYDSFTRFFGYITGMTLREYIRRRKLTLAAYELQHKNARIIDVAVKYGWDSADAFARAFRAQHGEVPSRMKSVRAYPPVSFQITVKGAGIMNYRIQHMDEIRLRGLTKPFTGASGDRFEQEHVMWVDTDHYMSRVNPSIPGIWYGVWDAGNYSIAKRADEVCCPDAHEIVIPAGEYAVFVSGLGGFAGVELPLLREQLFGQWLYESGYETAGDREIEVYHLYERPHRDKRQYELWVPIKRKENAAR